jgi:hypothetical protein
VIASVPRKKMCAKEASIKMNWRNCCIKNELSLTDLRGQIDESWSA